MKKNSLSSNGLSMSQAQSISNLCFQRALEISSMISGINNASKTVKIGEETYIEQVGKPMPDLIVELLQEKASLHALQAFLMENIKAKDSWLKAKKNDVFVSELDSPNYPKLKKFDFKDEVDENWGWEQLSIEETNEFLQVEATAAHIGQFIHKNSPLDNLRKELSTMKTLEWITIKDGEKTPLKVAIHHTPIALLDLHEKLANLHREAEQRVNYFKAKIKNLVTAENAKIARANADGAGLVNIANTALTTNYVEATRKYNDELIKQNQEFEAKRQDDIAVIAALRISVDKRFQPMVDSFLKKVD